ncbi:extracellular solute-binding protein [Sneathiella sp.]|uniref:extracellular solute-binding protein n=1 Tax=Sneathiella sp. TaxID=1964365 RepID=UPI002FE3BBD2
MRILVRCLIAALLLLPAAVAAAAEETAPVHAIAMHGAAKYPPGFTHFDYVNPEAPIGGHLRLGAIGSFDSLNPFILKGVPPLGLNHVYQTLLERSRDEPFTLYANIAKSIEVAPDRSWIIFNLDPQAYFSDGSPITAEDVLFSFEILRNKGRPNVQTYYRKVTEAEILSPAAIRFSFEAEGRFEMPLIMGLMSVLPKAAFETRSFETSSLSPFIGSGPYLIDRVDPGRRIVYRRDENFWGWHLPQNRGRFNFETVTYDFFRDDDIAFEAFKAGTLDARFETDVGRWARGYDIATRHGRQFVKSEPELSLPAPMQALVFNTRAEKFSDIRVREALTYAFDFEWLNSRILHGLYKRLSSYFENSPLAARGPIPDAERALLAPFRDELPPEIFTDTFSLPATDGSGRARENLRRAKELLASAGYDIANGRLTNRESGRPFEIEFLVNNTDFIRLITPFQRNLETLGIRSTVRQVDTASYQNRLNDYDFDMIINNWGQSLSPGNEQAFYWSRQAASTPGTRNYPGIRLAAVDSLIDRIATAKDRETLETAVRALDRVLLFGHYVIPLYYTDRQWLAHWPEIRLPDTASFWGTSADLWWYEAD